MKNSSINIAIAKFDGAYNSDTGLYQCELVTSWIPDSPNKTLRKFRFSQNNIRTGWDNLVWHLSRGKLPTQPLSHFSIECIRNAPRFLDWDNLVGSFKDVIDSFKHSGVILDDKYDMTGPWLVHAYKEKKQSQKIIIRINQKP